MTSMVERIARALHQCDVRRSDIVPPDILWEFGQKAYRGYALAALREMREPPHEFLSAGEAELINGAPLNDAIRAAIDAEIAAYEADRASPVLRPPS